MARLPEPRPVFGARRPGKARPSGVRRDLAKGLGLFCNARRRAVEFEEEERRLGERSSRQLKAT